MDKRSFPRGAVLENWHAPNIRGGENGGIAHWSLEDIIEYLDDGRNQHTAAMQRMGEVVSVATQHLTGDDLSAIAAYLRTHDDSPRQQHKPPSDTVLNAGAAICFDHCAVCHPC